MSHTRIKVRGYHLDMYGHVNNARYLEFLEEARWQMIEDHMDLGELMQRGIGLVVVNININYRSPAALGQVLSIDSRLASVSKRSAVIHQDITDQGSGRAIADADVTFAVVDTKTGCVRPIEGSIHDLLQRATGQE